MDFFGMGPMEILVILVVALVVFGPNKLPEVARNFGKAVNSFKKAASDMAHEATKDLEEEKKSLSKLASDINKDLQEEKRSLSQVASQINQDLNSPAVGKPPLSPYNASEQKAPAKPQADTPTTTKS